MARAEHGRMQGPSEGRCAGGPWGTKDVAQAGLPQTPARGLMRLGRHSQSAPPRRKPAERVVHEGVF